MGTHTTDAGDQEHPQDTGSAAGRAAGAGAFLLAVGALAFAAGSALTVAEVPPTETMRVAYNAGMAFVRQQREPDDPLQTDLWREARDTDRGVTISAPDAFSGYTLYTSGDGPYAALVDMDGNRVHEWRRPYSTVWDESAAVDDPRPDDMVYIRKARAFPNGDLLAIYAAVGDTPWGYGMVRLDRDSNVLWRYMEHTHHDFDVAPDGRIYALTHEVTDEEIGNFNRLEKPRLNDLLVILSPEGEELQRVSLTHALARSRYETLLHAAPYFSLGDPLHTNAVEVIDAAQAAAFPFGDAGDVILSFRELGLVAVLDVAKEEITWAMRGPWMGQHDPDLLPNGNILLFDNLGVFEGPGRSRVIEVDPRTMEIVWQYQGDAAHPMESAVRAAAERLPDGNTLITESDGGRLVEITPDGDIAWEFRNPVRGGEGGRFVPVMSWGQRIAPDAFDPAFLSTIAKRGSS